jgi:hypothetical protein
MAEGDERIRLLTLVKNVRSLNGLLPMFVVDKHRKSLARMHPGLRALAEPQKRFGYFEQYVGALDRVTILRHVPESLSGRAQCTARFTERLVLVYRANSRPLIGRGAVIVH